MKSSGSHDMTNDQLSGIIEKIALQVVLLDHTDISDMEEIITLFTEIADWANSNSQILLMETAVNCRDIINGIIDQSNSLPEESFEIICRTVTEIQTHARNDFNFSQMNLAPEICSQFTNAKHNEKTAVSSENSSYELRHPDSLPTYLDNELFAEFLSIQSNNLDKMESLILSIEERGDDASIIELKRMIHTIKGEAGFLNLNEVESVCHLTEDILGQRAPAQHSDIFLKTIDWMRQTFSWYSGGSFEPDSSTQLIKEIETCKSLEIKNGINNLEEMDTGKLEKKIIEQLVDNPSVFSTNHALYNKFISRIDNSIDSSKKFISKLLTLIDNVHEDEQHPTVAIQQSILKLQYYMTKITAVSDFISLNEIQLLTKHTHNLLDKMITDFRFCRTDIVNLIQESFNFLSSQTRYMESALLEKKIIKYEENFPQHIARLQAVLIEVSGNNKLTETKPAIQESSAIIPLNKDLTEPDADEDTTTQPSVIKTSPQIKESINVDAERLDRIIDMIGELVIAESMVIQAEEIKKIDSQELTRHLSQMDKITRALQETGLSLRMLPIKSTFQKMARIARDTAKKADKDVKFITQGEETELDKTLVDKIGDPLLHMVRNAIDHGIETSAEERQKQDKPVTGVVTIRAFHKGGNIHVEIEDDGKGLDKQRIRQKAVERNIIHEDDILNDKEIFNLIFEPGFSTASEITDLSGRGVGMNVVKSSIEALHGQVEIRSEQGIGSTFTIKIPLTLAIIDGMVVRVQNERYIIPTLSIVTSNELDRNNVTSIFKKGDMVDVQGKLVPLFLLSNLLGTDLEKNTPSQSLMVVVEEDDKQAAIVVDELLGKQQIVIKTLGESMKNIPGISGGAIMPDGRVGLIIDVGGLVKLAHAKDMK